MKDDRLYLIHITECIERIERYTAAGRAAFFALAPCALSRLVLY